MNTQWIRALLLFASLMPALAAAALPLDTLRLPPGFRIEVFAEVPNARQMALGKQHLFVGSMRAGKVYAVPLAGPRKPIVLVDGLNMPVGVALRNGDLYVSAVNRILRVPDAERNLKRARTEVVTDAYPRDTHHGWKFIAFGPDGRLYVPVGAPCNICDPDTGRYANITALDLKTKAIEVVARGVRNTVGFDWQPGTNELWFTDNGRDMLGDDLPPDELNHAPRAGLHFGYPYCHAGTLADPEFGRQRPCSEFTPPAQALGLHVAALGMRFYTGRQFPADYRGQVFIAEHGSWNRSRRIGYRVSLVRLEAGKAVSYTPFATGWLQGESAWGRPADVLVVPDGSLLVADDLAGAIYRIRHGG